MDNLNSNSTTEFDERSNAAAAALQQGAGKLGNLIILQGVLAIILGIGAMAWPGITVTVFVIFWGVYALLDGIALLISAFGGNEGSNNAPRWLMFLSGGLGVLAGVVGIFSPLSAAITLTWIFGIWTIARGIVLFITAFGAPGSARWSFILSGILFIVAGILFSVNPVESMLGFAWLLGLMVVVWGISLIIGGIQWKKNTAH